MISSIERVYIIWDDVLGIWISIFMILCGGVDLVCGNIFVKAVNKKRHDGMDEYSILRKTIGIRKRNIHLNAQYKKKTIVSSMLNKNIPQSNFIS